MAVREAVLPENCSRTIYMCDDGKDPLKRDWVDSLGPDVIYVSGEPPARKRGRAQGTKSRTASAALAKPLLSCVAHATLALFCSLYSI